MARAYDRVKNANQNGDVFIKTAPWTNDVEDAFEQWKAKGDSHCLSELVSEQLAAEVAVSFKALDGSICCTLAHQPSKDGNLPYLLTGWSDNADEAIAVALFKLAVMMNGIWAQPPLPPAVRRR